MTLGQIAYEAYCKARNWKSVRGEALPQFAAQSAELRQAWEAAGDCVAAEFIEPLRAAYHALSSYGHGNASADLAAEVAKYIKDRLSQEAS